MKTIAQEIERAIKAGAQKISKFSKSVRSTELNNIQDGDIILIPASYEVLEQKVRNSDQTAEYIFVEVIRNGSKKNVQFYPSLFWKSREVCTPDGVPTGDWKRSSGEVCDFVQNFVDIDEALQAIAKDHPNGIKVKMEKIKTLRYGAAVGSKPQDTNIPELTWA